MTALTMRVVGESSIETSPGKYLQLIISRFGETFINIGEEKLRRGELILLITAGSLVSKFLITGDDYDINTLVKIDAFKIQGPDIENVEVAGAAMSLESDNLRILYGVKQNVPHSVAVTKFNRILKSNMVGTYLSQSLGIEEYNEE